MNDNIAPPAPMSAEFMVDTIKDVLCITTPMDVYHTFMLGIFASAVAMALTLPADTPEQRRAIYDKISSFYEAARSAVPGGIQGADVIYFAALREWNSLRDEEPEVTGTRH